MRTWQAPNQVGGRGENPEDGKSPASVVHRNHKGHMYDEEQEAEQDANESERDERMRLDLLERGGREVIRRQNVLPREQEDLGDHHWNRDFKVCSLSDASNVCYPGGR